MSGLTIREIEGAIESGNLSLEDALILLSFREDGASIRLKKRLLKEQKIREDYAMRAQFSKKLREEGYRRIAGLDEVGRGPLAGPVTVACVILDPERPIYGLRDSKKLSAKRRDELALEIREKAHSYTIVSFTEQQVDELNILQATREAMKLAVESMDTEPDYLLLDALTIDMELPQLPLVGGDERCNEIAAASILAKTERDAYMEAMHQRYPQYGFDSNKGYGTPQHLQALREHGLCPLHRRSFLKRFIQED